MSRCQLTEPVAPDTGVEAPVPLPNVTSKILSKVIEYAKFHVDKPAAAAAEAGTEPAAKELGEEAKAWNAEFVKVDQGTLFELILVRPAAGCRLDVENLLLTRLALFRLCPPNRTGR
jgi:S-phase kinase-associated protein 1